MPITISLISAMYRTRLDHPLLKMGSNIVNIYKENAYTGIVMETSIKSSYGEGGGMIPIFNAYHGGIPVRLWPLYMQEKLCQRDTMLIYDLIMLHVDINKSHVKAEGRSMPPRYTCSYKHAFFKSGVCHLSIIRGSCDVYIILLANIF